MKRNLLFDMGGVLMSHNVKGSRAAFVELMGEENVQKILGLLPNGEGSPHTIMEDFEWGRISEEDFIETLRQASKSGTSSQQIEAAWNIMHAGIAAWKLEQVRKWHDEGNHVLLLSNSNSIHCRDVMTNYDMSMFDQCFYSHLIKAAKPDARFFEVVLNYLKEQGWEDLPTVFVDDLEANRVAGEAYGWTTYPSIDQVQ